MKTLRINTAEKTDYSWNNKYTIFSESVGLLQKLISIPSFSGEEDSAADQMEKHLKIRNVQVNRHGNNIWAYNKYYDPDKPTILLNSHLDTVKPNEGYTRDPFCPEITDSRLYGLGSNDAGGCLISLMAAFLHYYHQQRMGFNLCFAATAEEENSGNNGIRLLLPLLGRLDFAIVGEPTLLQMAVTEKGNMVIDCTCTGVSAHAAREEGDNAIYKSLTDIEWFKNYCFSKSSRVSNPVKMTVTGIKAGLQHNIIPGICDFTVDIRHDDAFSQEQILDVIRSHVNSKIKVRPGRLKASSVSLKHPVIKAGIALGCKTYDSPTSSDRGWLNCPSVKLGPGDSARSHMPDEYIFLEEIKKGINLYIRLLDQLPLQLINNPFLAQVEINPLNN